MSISPPTLSREPRVLGFRKLTARPCHHGQGGEALEALKNFPTRLEQTHRPSRISPAKPIFWRRSRRQLTRWARSHCLSSRTRGRPRTTGHLTAAVAAAEQMEEASQDVYRALDDIARLLRAFFEPVGHHWSVDSSSATGQAPASSRGDDRVATDDPRACASPDYSAKMSDALYWSVPLCRCSD